MFINHQDIRFKIFSDNIIIAKAFNECSIIRCIISRNRSMHLYWLLHDKIGIESNQEE